MREYVILIAVALVCLAIGIIFGRFSKKSKPNGIIVIEPTEDGERDRIRFILNIGLDEITVKNQIIFTVENHLSQN